MTVMVTPRRQVQRRDIYTGVTRVVSDGLVLSLHCASNPPVLLVLSTVAEISLDEDRGAIEAP